LHDLYAWHDIRIPGFSTQHLHGPRDIGLYDCQAAK